MNNSINRPASVGRRFVGALIDLFIIIFLTVMINSYIVTPLANNVVDLKDFDSKTRTKMLKINEDK